MNTAVFTDAELTQAIWTESEELFATQIRSWKDWHADRLVELLAEADRREHRSKRGRVRRWLTSWVADDPAPTYSAADRKDGLR